MSGTKNTEEKIYLVTKENAERISALEEKEYMEMVTYRPGVSPDVIHVTEEFNPEDISLWQCLKSALGVL